MFPSLPQSQSCAVKLTNKILVLTLENVITVTRASLLHAGRQNHALTAHVGRTNLFDEKQMIDQQVQKNLIFVIEPIFVSE